MTEFDKNKKLDIGAIKVTINFIATACVVDGAVCGQLEQTHKHLFESFTNIFAIYVRGRYFNLIYLVCIQDPIMEKPFL